MRLFKKNKKRKNNAEIEKKVMKQKMAIKSFMFVIGAFLSAISFNLFYLPYNFVGGGLGGVAVILNNFFPINSAIVMLIGNTIFSIISIYTLGFKKSLMGIIGATIYTLFVYATQSIPELINFSFDNVVLYVLAAGVVGGFGESLVYKAGFNTGGTSIIAEVISHYTKQPLGKILRCLAYAIILGGGFTFGYTAIMYSIIISTLSTSMVDKMLIGIGDSKIFYINTDEEEAVKDFIINTIECGVTELASKGGYFHKKNITLMCVVPTEKYTLLKSAIREIDPEAFIVINDCYETVGGTKRKLIELDEEV